MTTDFSLLYAYFNTRVHITCHCSLCRPCTHANLDARATCVGAEGRQQGHARCSHHIVVDLSGVEHAVLRQSYRNPQSTNVVIKCPECKEFKWSYFFQKHWDKHHKRSKGDMPATLETSIAISGEERGYFKRGQKKLGKKRRSSGGTKASSKKKSKGGGASATGGGAGAGAGAGAE